MTEQEKREAKIQGAKQWLERSPDDPQIYSDILNLIYGQIQDGLDEYHGRNIAFRDEIIAAMRRIGKSDFRKLDRLNGLYRQSLLMSAKVDFDSYCLYIEANRAPQKQFYLPRRRVLGPIANSMSELATGDLELLAISLPPGVGKTTLAIFFLTWLAGRNPDLPKLTGSHSNAFIKGVYEECLRIFDPNGEYLWHDVFPELKVESTNAKDCRIDIGKRKRFETLEFTSIGTGNAGLYRAAELLYCDDLVSGIEVALSNDRLDKLWETYTTDLRQRKMDGCKELHIATRWSVRDVIGRLERQFDGDPRARFIVIPALNEADESNFDYLYGVGFSTKAYHEQRDIMEDANWRALYMNEPIEREGQLYHPDELRRFFELPDREPDGIVAVCDTKAKGSDYAFMPILYLYGKDVYVADCICDNGDPGVVEERLAQLLVKHRVQMCQFESNSAGWHIAEKVQARIKELGGNTKITTKMTTANKETKIIVQSASVKSRCLFLDGSQYKGNTDYGRAMAMLTSYTMTGRNKHDDVCDGMAMSMIFLDGMYTNRVEVIQRPW